MSPRRAWLIGWAWPTLGAGWTDPACWILRLMASGGHTAPEAERQASRLPAFQAADPAHIDLCVPGDQLMSGLTGSWGDSWPRRVWFGASATPPPVGRIVVLRPLADPAWDACRVRVGAGVCAR